jgi:BirA family biotin operon repressor/biotin-[acetyl-CoA-carboxylase] ligase
MSAPERWTVLDYDEVASTNLAAATCPAWQAVRAARQTAGRGRFQRGWVSDEGGLWLSAVVPLDPASPGGRILPLAAGWVVCDALQELGVAGLRLRWPNDVLAGDRKLAGILIDSFARGLAVVGIGLNVHNRPESSDPRLWHQTERLDNLVPAPVALETLTDLLLRRLGAAVDELLARRSAPLLAGVNRLWALPRRVELNLDGPVRTGQFAGVDESGRLLLLDAAGVESAFAPEEVRHLRELEDLP